MGYPLEGGYPGCSPIADLLLLPPAFIMIPDVLTYRHFIQPHRVDAVPPRPELPAPHHAARLRSETHHLRCAHSPQQADDPRHLYLGALARPR